MPPVNLPIDPALPITNLSELGTQLYHLFNNICYHWAPLLFAEPQRAPLRDAWDAIKMRLPSETDTWFTSHVPEHDLANAGLTGSELQMKLHSISSAWSRFFNQGGIKLLKELLKWLNSILARL